MKVLWLAITCFILGGVIIGGALQGQAREEVREVEVVREVPVETVKTVETEVVPQSCLTAITLSQEINVYIAQISQAQGEQVQVMAFARQAMTVDGFMDLGHLQVQQDDLKTSLIDSYTELDRNQQALSTALAQCQEDTK